ncbi:MAG: Rid family detoxifying hydrolase [Tetragenococcus halophilus]|uniref:YjgF/YER057c/UK114 family protein n=3 Tax=Tetragenococcus halophilus TaxID=51669 RepID=A0A2H6CUY6_TETHA|nr:Rid family detoxifying hydrolase [Tetragenococcus halophilus]MDN6641010.1 Rid family detoxifying hydrolase [Tetragenococcus sp.]MCF1674829.1 Rid family detoxifying hydrolase [Tetragenococcus halophilus]MCO8297171.1 RidA family protein [Tetragenococcus halophilus]MDN5831102.1 Rid family detoxifying hydrolase [Tetragenococcus halophilus]MDN6112333.1 Rid family detoxifying hydrolase [Tetragenococcus halophilus]
MTKNMINTKQAPAAVGPYSHAVLVGNQVFISGQLGLDPVSKKLQASVTDQAKQAFNNLGAILQDVDLTFSDIVKTTVFLTDMADFIAVNEVYADYFGEWKPARSCFVVKELPLGGSFEIEAIAMK